MTSWEKCKERARLAEVACLYWSSTFSRYESAKANGITTVKVDEVVSDFRRCHNFMDATLPYNSPLKNYKP